MQTALTDIQSEIRNLFRQYQVDGDPNTGLNHPDITRLRAVFGTSLITLLSRSLLGPEGVDYPTFPATGALSGNVAYLFDNNGTLEWALISATDIARAAELVDFEGSITAEVQAAAAQVVADIQDDAPFNERYDTENDLTADLNFPDGAIAIAFDTMRIFKKSGASGEGSWSALAVQPLATLPGSASLADLQALEARVVALEASLEGVSNLAARIDRLDGFHPFQAPVWDDDIPQITGPANSPIVPLDLSEYVTDGDSAELTFVATGLLAGLSLNGNVISGTPTEFGPERDVALSVTDVNGQRDDTTVLLRIYDPDAPAPNPPVWTQVPNQTVIVGSQITPINYASFLAQSIDDVNTITVAITGQPSGLSLSNKLLSGAPQQVGFFTVRATATSASGITATITHNIGVQAPRPSNSGGSSGGGGADPGDGSDGFFDNPNEFS